MVTAIKEDCSAIIDYKLLCGFKCGKVHPSSNKKKSDKEVQLQISKIGFYWVSTHLSLSHYSLLGNFGSDLESQQSFQVNFDPNT